MQFYYSKSWFRAHKRALNTLTADEAKNYHEGGKGYVVLVDSVQNPTAFIEVNMGLGYVGVFFLSPNLEIELEYIFAKSETDPQRLFLQRSVFRNYLPLDNKLKNSEVVYFNENGKVSTQKTDNITGQTSTFESESPINVDSNWEELPKFADYESLLRRERL